MNLNSKDGLIARLRRDKQARRSFTESHVNKAVAHQIRAIRDALGWSQERLAKEVGMNQNAISRLESADYGKPTITTLKRLAAAFDVSLIVRFATFSEVVDWVSGTPRVNRGLNSQALAVPDFATEEAVGSFGLALGSPSGFESSVTTDGRYFEPKDSIEMRQTPTRSSADEIKSLRIPPGRADHPLYHPTVNTAP